MRLVILSILNVGALVVGCTNAPPEGPDLSATVAASVQATVEAHQTASPNPTPSPPTPVATPVPVSTQAQMPTATPAPVATPTQQSYALPTVPWKTPTPGYVEDRLGAETSEVASFYSKLIEAEFPEEAAMGAANIYHRELGKQRRGGASLEEARDGAAEYAIRYGALNSVYSRDVAEIFDEKVLAFLEAGLALDDAMSVALEHAKKVGSAIDLGYSRHQAIDLADSMIEAELAEAIANADLQPDGDKVNDGTATEVSLRELVNDYLTNAVRADVKYESPFLVSGRITEIGSTGVVMLGAGGFNHVEARVTDKTDLLEFDTGNEVHLHCQRAEGSTDSLGAFIYLKGCSVTSESSK